MIRCFFVSLVLVTLVACGQRDSCETSVAEPACDAGFEPIPADYACADETGVSEWICVAEDIGTPCDASGPIDVCGSDLLCVTEPDSPDQVVGTCLPLCGALDGDCTLLGSEWACVTTSNGPDVCAADWAS